MAGITKKDKQAARDAVEILFNILPKTETRIRNIAYTFGLICREAGIPLKQATAAIVSWSERLRALPNFSELYPLYQKPSLYRYYVRYSMQSAYKRTDDKPSIHWFKALTGKEPPEASFWVDIKPSYKKSDKKKTPKA
jgi:hypothetical protein